MPYSIQTKDGITINNIPDDVKPDSPELKNRVAEIRAGKVSSSEQPVAAKSAPVAPNIPKISAYAPQQQGIMQQIRESAPVVSMIGPTEAQRMAQSVPGPDGQMAYKPYASQVEQRGFIPAMASTLASAAGGPDVSKMLGGQSGDISVPAATTAGAIKGAQAGSKLGPLGALAGSAIGGGTAFVGEKYRQYLAGEGAAATAPEAAKATALSAVAPYSPGASAFLNYLKLAPQTVSQTLGAETLRRFMAGEPAMTGSEMAREAALPVILSGAAAKLSATKDMVPKEGLAQRLREKGWLVPTATGEFDLAIKGGKQAISDLASMRNAETAIKVLKRANGVPDNVPLTKEWLSSQRDSLAANGYGPIRAAGEIVVDPQFRSDLNKITQARDSAERAFKGAFKDATGNQIGKIGRAKTFNASDGIDAIRTLREDAEKAFSDGDRIAGRAKLAASKVIEDQIERGLASRGADGEKILNLYRSTRKQLAINFATSEGLRRGGETIKPESFRQLYDDGVELSNGLEDIGAIASNFPSFAKDPSRIHNVGASEAKRGVAAAATGLAYMASSNAPIQYRIPAIAAAATLPYAMDIGRSIALSKPYQAMAHRAPMPAESVNYMNLLAREFGNK